MVFFAVEKVSPPAFGVGVGGLNGDDITALPVQHGRAEGIARAPAGVGGSGR
jgi:hypothetical protein